ncbi:hypothetical protein ACP275_03G041500 [Erythranthe tilingii]
MEYSSWFYSVSLLTLLFLVPLSKLIHQRKRYRIKNFPPSPAGKLPIIGHLHLLKTPLHKTLNQFSQKHGPIISLRFGFRNAVVLSSPSAVEECFTKNDTLVLNRPKFLSGKLLNYNFTTLGAVPYGPLWKNLRRLTAVEIFSTARLNGFSGIRQDETNLLLKKLYQLSSRGGFVKVEMKSKLSELSFNIVMRIVARKRYFGDHEMENESEVRRFRVLIEELSYLSGASNPGDFLPFLQWFDYQNLEKRMIILQKEMDSFLQGLIDERRRNGDCGGEKTTMIDSMLALQVSEPENYSDQIIKGIILVVLMAGTDTSAVTMEWSMSLLLNHPDVLNKAKTELDRYVGGSRLVNEHDITKLPYLRGIINETLRLYPAIPLLVPRESSDDCTIGPFDVPSQTMFLVNAWAIHRDPRVWVDPERFDPDRYAGLEDEDYRYRLVPFGAGRRKCPGSGLANRVVALALAALVQCFEWERIGGGEAVDMAEGGGLSMPKAVPLEAMCRAREDMMHVLFKL